MCDRENCWLSDDECTSDYHDAELLDGLNPDGSYPEICPVCEVDHRWTMADLSHANIRLIEHAQERFTWMEYPVNGDMIARQRAGILNTSLLFSTTDPEEIDWDYINGRKEQP